jgi:hypothetical protein
MNFRELQHAGTYDTRYLYPQRGLRQNERIPKLADKADTDLRRGTSSAFLIFSDSRL